MTQRIPIRSEVWQGEDIVTFADIRDDANAALTSTSAPTFSVTVWARSAGYPTPGTQVYALLNQSTSTVLPGAFSTSGGWDQNATGWCFRHGIAASAFAQQGGTTVRIEYALSTSTEGTKYVVHECKILSMMNN